MVIVADAIAVAVVGDDLGKCGEYSMFGDIPKGNNMYAIDSIIL